MSPLRMNLTDLTRLQRQWASVMPFAEQDGGRLTEVEAFGSNPGELRMLTFVPPGLPAGAPLVVVLHGCGQTASGYDAGTGWSQLAERHGFALLLPEQRRANNAHTCFNWFEPQDVTRGEGEVASIRQMVARCVADHRLDARRVMVTGLSAGGAMTSAMLAAYPEVFAAGAVIAGLPFGAAAGVNEALGAMHHARDRPAAAWGDLVRAASPMRGAPGRPAVAIWHGDADHTVAVGNALQSVRQWTDSHGLREADGREDTVDGVPHRSWCGPDGRVLVELYRVPGLGHGTPVAPREPGDRGVGQAMPFVLEAPIPSTWHIAKSWGLIGASAGKAPEAAPPKGPAAAPAPSAAEGLIARTLRAAGLMGRG